MPYQAMAHGKNENPGTNRRKSTALFTSESSGGGLVFRFAFEVGGSTSCTTKNLEMHGAKR